MTKLVVKLDIHDKKDKKKAMNIASSISGVDSINMDMKSKKLTLTGDFDPIKVVSKLRKSWQHADIESVGSEKEPEKKDAKKEGDKKQDDNKKTNAQPIAQYYYNPYMAPPRYVGYSTEEDPNSCVIC